MPPGETAKKRGFAAFGGETRAIRCTSPGPIPASLHHRSAANAVRDGKDRERPPLNKPVPNR
jgi:hypothetical protein